MKNRHSIFILAVVAALIALCFSATSAAGPETTGRWDPAGSLPIAYSVHSHWLPTGKAMVWPGDGDISGDDPRSWDPAVTPLSFTSLAKPGYNIFCSGHTFLADGGLFVAGGHNGTNTSANLYGLKRASIYNSFANAWSYLPDMNAGRWYPTNTILVNGDPLVVSGSVDPSTGVNLLPQVFQMATGTWRNLTGAQLGQDLYPHMLLAPNGKVFNPGPTAVTRYLDTAGSGSWSFVANRFYQTTNRDYGSAVMYAPGKVLSVGGGNPPTKTAEVIDLNASTPSWSPVGSMQFARRQINALLLPDGKVLVTGGTSGSGFNNTSTPVFAAEMWDPAQPGTWTTMASASIPRLYHSSTVLMADGRVLSTGGNNQPQIEIFSPPYLFNSAGGVATRPTITSAPSTVNYGQSIFVQTPDAATITKVTILSLSSTTHAFNQSQSRTELSFTTTAGGLNITMPSNAVTPPPNPNVTPPGYYLLFILNGSGVPSVASIVKLTQQSQTVTAPTVTTLPASAVGATGATLNGTANPNGAATTGWFRYNTTSPGTCNDTFGTLTPSTGLGSGTAAVAYSQGLTGLTASTTYYFCAIASNSAGKSFGSVLSFTTSAGGSGGSLSGSGTSVTAASLTTEGTVDWIHWGETPLNRKAGVTAQLSTYTLPAGGTVLGYNDDPRGLTWSDGAPIAA
ncbi:MAG: DUF1929 domain-containing protein, partial [Methylococcales bacterium]|nr:DUF1929 domain-containing protein [Methylococcales bacterium]